MTKSHHQSAELPNAVIIAEPQQNVGLLLTEVLRSIQFRNYKMVADVDYALNMLRSGEARLLIVDDTASIPCAFVMRRVIMDPIASLTPTLVLMATNDPIEHASISSIGRPMLVEKPLSPQKVMAALQTLQKVWSSGYFQDFKQIATFMIEGRNEDALKILTRLSTNPRSQVIVAPAAANMCRRMGNFSAAEKILLTSLKLSPRDFGVILALADFYLSSSMPQAALELIENIEQAVGKCSVTMIDKFISLMMLEKLDRCALVLRDIMLRKFFPDLTKDFLARILFSEGRAQEANKVIGDEGKAQALAAAWSAASMDAPAPTQQKAS